ncbi:MAG: hypothetical protein OXH75_01965 [Acidobacteria bacterium]|nr:hypothetical protein [Acidobacteriota bacterium]
MLDAEGKVLGERAFEHGGAGLSAMAAWLMSLTVGRAGDVGVALETPRGSHGAGFRGSTRSTRSSLTASGTDSHRRVRRTIGGMRGFWHPRCDRPALPAASGIDRPDDRWTARVVAAQRGPDPGADESREPNAGAALALLPAVPRGCCCGRWWAATTASGTRFPSAPTCAIWCSGSPVAR